jgi:hypothetical protein
LGGQGGILRVSTAPWMSNALACASVYVRMGKGAMPPAAWQVAQRRSRIGFASCQ